MSGNQFYKIHLAADIAKLALQVERLQVTSMDLMDTIAYADEMINALNSNPLISDTAKKALSTSAIIAYTRCFNSDYALPLSPDIFSTVIPDPTDENSLSERDFHRLIMNYRNQHIAHSNSMHNITALGGQVQSGGRIGLHVIAASRAPVEDTHFYQSIKILATTAIAYVRSQMNAKFAIIEKSFAEGKTTLTNDPCQITPIPAGTSAKDLWQLT